MICWKTRWKSTDHTVALRASAGTFWPRFFDTLGPSKSARSPWWGPGELSRNLHDLEHVREDSEIRDALENVVPGSNRVEDVEEGEIRVGPGGIAGPVECAVVADDGDAQLPHFSGNGATERRAVAAPGAVGVKRHGPTVGRHRLVPGNGYADPRTLEVIWRTIASRVSSGSPCSPPLAFDATGNSAGWNATPASSSPNAVAAPAMRRE